jgi:glyoxylase-like metal-dependent hydrolase (beta-lactamase superfamily II)
MSAVAHLETELAGLYASPSQALPFAPSLHARAFLLRRDAGSLLVYSVADLRSASAAFEGLGGLQRQYLGHWHEAMFAAGRLDVPLFVHENDRGQTEQRTVVAGTFSEPQTLDGDFEIIPIPGHTPGATAYLWDSGQQRLLFTGDTIYLSDGDWVAAVLDSSDRDAYIESLERLRELDFDVLVPWAATAGAPYHAVTDRADAQRRISAILKRVRRGESR